MWVRTIAGSAVVVTIGVGCDDPPVETLCVIESGGLEFEIQTIPPRTGTATCFLQSNFAGAAADGHVVLHVYHPEKQDRQFAHVVVGMTAAGQAWAGGTLSVQPWNAPKTGSTLPCTYERPPKGSAAVCLETYTLDPDASGPPPDWTVYPTDGAGTVRVSDAKWPAELGETGRATLTLEDVTFGGSNRVTGTVRMSLYVVEEPPFSRF